MPVDFHAGVDPESLRRFNASMEGMARELRMSQEGMVLSGGKFLLRSLSAQTAIAPKYRAYRRIARSRSGQHRYEVRRDYPSFRTFEVSAPSVSALKRKSSVQIRARGLAKASWWHLGLLSGIRGIPRGPGKTDAGQRVHATFQRGDNPRLTLSNRLHYIVDALRGGASAVEEAADKASRAMLHYVDEVLKRQGVR